MPIYEYRCNECGTHVERRQSISEVPLKICEKCGGVLEKQVSLSGFQFKGQGWYVTDYAAKKGKTGESTASNDKGEKTSGGESTTKTDTASNTKSDAKIETTTTPKTETAAKKE